MKRIMLGSNGPGIREKERKKKNSFKGMQTNLSKGLVATWRNEVEQCPVNESPVWKVQSRKENGTCVLREMIKWIIKKLRCWRTEGKSAETK